MIKQPVVVRWEVFRFVVFKEKRKTLNEGNLWHSVAGYKMREHLAPAGRRIGVREKMLNYFFRII